jgi:hypothetical protein
MMLDEIDKVGQSNFLTFTLTFTLAATLFDASLFDTVS